MRRYRHFPTVPDALALVLLLRRAAITFKTRYVRGANYDRARHEPDRVEVWIGAAAYDRVRQFEAALTREQALALAANYPLLALPDEELRAIAAQPSPAAAVASSIILARKL